MAELAALEALVRPYIGDCPYLLVEKHLRTAFRKFATDSWAWKLERQVILPAGSTRMVLPLTSQQVLLAVLSVAEHDKTTATSLPYYVANGFIVFDRVFDESKMFDLCLALKPSLGVTEIDDDLYENWGEAIAFRAAYEILIQPNRQWSNPALGKELEGRYLDEIVNLRNLAGRGNVAGSQAVTPVPWA